MYTDYGALITHLENSYKDMGYYSQIIDLKSMGLAQGIYLIKYSYPGFSETKVAITAVK